MLISPQDLLLAATLLAAGSTWTPATPAPHAQAALAAIVGAASAGLEGAASAAPAEEHGLSQKPVEVARPLGFPITNSMLVTWIVAALLIVFAQHATRNMHTIPDGLQNLLEWLVESLYGFLEGIIGRHLVDRTFWFFGSVFIFILSANWIGLVPGVGSIGWGHSIR